jgi:hypothetical protein
MATSPAAAVHDASNSCITDIECGGSTPPASAIVGHATAATAMTVAGDVDMDALLQRMEALRKAFQLHYRAFLSLGGEPFELPDEVRAAARRRSCRASFPCTRLAEHDMRAAVADRLW